MIKQALTEYFTICSMGIYCNFMRILKKCTKKFWIVIVKKYMYFSFKSEGKCNIFFFQNSPVKAVVILFYIFFFWILVKSNWLFSFYITSILLVQVQKSNPRIIEIKKLIYNILEQVWTCIWHPCNALALKLSRKTILTTPFIVIFLDQILMKGLLTRK